MEWFSTIANARLTAEANSARDGVAWVILRDDVGFRTTVYDGLNHSFGKYCHFGATDEFDGDIKNYTFIDKIGNKTLDPNLLEIKLTRDEWALVKEMLDIDEEEASLAIGDVKSGLLAKLKMGSVLKSNPGDSV